MPTDGLDRLSYDLEQAADRIDEEVKKVVGQGCLNIKKDVQAQWRRVFHPNSHLKHLWKSVSYDVTKTPGSDIIHGEVGPVLTRKQGPLGGIAEEGTVNNAPASPALGPALLKESPKFEEFVGKVAQELLDG